MSALNAGEQAPGTGTQAAAETPRHREFRRRQEISLSMLSGSGLPSLDRTLTYEQVDRLRAQVRDLAPSPLAEVLLRQAYRAILDHETRGLGRIAGSTYNILGKLVVPPLLAPPPGPVLEIGTLYGLFIPALMRQLHRSGTFRHLTVVDPFTGSQVQPGTTKYDDPSGVPVTAEVARRNLVTCGLAPDEFRLIQGYSTEAGVRARAGDTRYAVVVIDGDHSEDGVLADLRWVETVCLPNAVVVMDDYGDARWTGVERAVSRYLHRGGRLKVIGAASTSAYLRMPTAS